MHLLSFSHIVIISNALLLTFIACITVAFHAVFAATVEGLPDAKAVD
jgi:hypothetical protein